jgi:hypothetical protein
MSSPSLTSVRDQGPALAIHLPVDGEQKASEEIWYDAQEEIIDELVAKVSRQSLGTLSTDVVKTRESSPMVPYFGYGSNLSPSFLYERLKEGGDWLPDGRHKSGEFRGPVPVDLGIYALSDFEVGYTLDQGNDTTGNIVPKRESCVYGSLYKISKEQIDKLDISEDVPKGDYYRVALKVHKVATALFDKTDKRNDEEEAMVYVGNPHMVTKWTDPDPEYVDLLVSSATERGISSEYIDRYLRVRPRSSCGKYALRGLRLLARIASSVALKIRALV